MTGGLAQLELITQPDFYTHLTAQTLKLTQGLAVRARKANISLFTHSIGICLVFSLLMRMK